jgi:L-asparaginase
MKKKIAIITTGGTIAGSGKAGTANDYQAGTFDIYDILASIPQAGDLADLQLFEVAQIDSNDISFAHYQKIKEIVSKLNQDEEINGIVITHGTDTLEESAFLLNLVLDVHKPVVMTGAMRPATATSADGPYNLYQAIALACDESAAAMGVLAVFSNTIYAGRDLLKTNSIKTDAFKNTEFGILGYMRDDQVYLLHSPYRRHTYMSEFKDMDLLNLPKTEIFYVHQESDPWLLQAMTEHYPGLVLAGTGSGNYPSAIKELIEESDQSDCTIVRSSRLNEGAVYDSPAFDPLEKTIPSIRLQPHKARLLLMLCLAKGYSKEKIRQAFETY